MRRNVSARSNPVFTHEGAPAFRHLTAEQTLRRSVMSCLLWEREFYEEGQSIADRIVESAEKVKPETLAAVAIEAREVLNLRHVPLLLLDVLSKTGKGTPLVADTVARVIQRPDELGELLAVYWRNGRKMIPHGMQAGLQRAFGKFDEHRLAKYDRDGAIKLRDVLRLVRPKPIDEAQSALFKRVKYRTLATPDTWEVALSSGANKKETFERLLRDGNLGYLALLRNLRNMASAGVDDGLVRDAIVARKNGAHRVFPFRYVAAARAAPQYEPAIDKAMLASLEQMPKLGGKTVVVIDVSGSMYHSQVSAKSDMTRADVGSALGAFAREMFSDVRIFATAGCDGLRKHATKEVPARRGMALVDAIHGMCHPLGGGGIFTKQVMDYLRGTVGMVDRLIVITDEQDCGGSGDSPLAAEPIAPNAYMINVASYKNGIGYGKWTHIDGFSEGVLRYIIETEKAD